MPPISPPYIAPPYTAMSAFAAPALPRAQLWRTIAGLFLWAVITVVIVMLLVVPAVIHYGPTEARRLTDMAMTSGTPVGMIALLFSFLPLLLGLGLTVLVLMRRNPLTLLGPLGPFARNFAKVGLPLMALWLLFLPLTISGSDVSPHLTWAELSPWLAAALTGLLIQTATEEVVFRGYLQQQLAARFASRWVWLGVPSVLFGLAHYSGQPALQFDLLTMLWAGCFGLAAADLTARSGNLGAALALHFTNNISAILLVGFDGPLGGLSLYTVTPASDGATLIYFAQDGMGLLVGWLIARLMLRR